MPFIQTALFAVDTTISSMHIDTQPDLNLTVHYTAEVTLTYYGKINESKHKTFKSLGMSTEPTLRTDSGEFLLAREVQEARLANPDIFHSDLRPWLLR